MSFIAPGGWKPPYGEQIGDSVFVRIKTKADYLRMLAELNPYDYHDLMLQAAQADADTILKDASRIFGGREGTTMPEENLAAGVSLRADGRRPRHEQSRTSPTTQEGPKVNPHRKEKTMPRNKAQIPAAEIDPERSIEDQLDEQEAGVRTNQTLDDWLRTLDLTPCKPSDVVGHCEKSIVLDRETYWMAKEEFGCDDFTRVWLPSTDEPTILLQDEAGARYPYLPNNGSVEPLTPPKETSTDMANRGNSTAKPKSGKKPKEEPVARTFSNADPAERIGKLLIQDHYPELAHQPIIYIFTSVADTIGGEPIVCRPTKISGFAAWLAAGAEDGEASPMFVVLISQTHWDNMPQRGKEAFLDSALSQFKVTKSGALKMGQLDIRESSAVLARYGMYSKKLKDQAALLRSALEQPALELAS